jgi:NCS1 family nucleobase:cation symporter-1
VAVIGRGRSEAGSGAFEGIYGRWAWRGIVSYVVGFVVMIPFFPTGFYTGQAAQALGGADISFVPGLLAAGGLYYLLSRNIDHDAEAAARRRSQLVLEGTPE